MNLYQKLLAPISTFVLTVCGVCFAGTLSALNSLPTQPLPSILAAKITPEPTAGIDVLDLLCLGLESVWLVLVLVVGVLVLKEFRQPLDVN